MLVTNVIKREYPFTVRRKRDGEVMTMLITAESESAARLLLARRLFDQRCLVVERGIFRPVAAEHAGKGSFVLEIVLAVMKR